MQFIIKISGQTFKRRFLSLAYADPGFDPSKNSAVIAPSARVVNAPWRSRATYDLATDSVSFRRVVDDPERLASKCDKAPSVASLPTGLPAQEAVVTIPLRAESSSSLYLTAIRISRLLRRHPPKRQEAGTRRHPVRHDIINGAGP